MSDRLQDLPESTCLQLLGGSGVGRIAINGDPSPLVVPVNYAARGMTIVFTTAGGAKWEAARAGQPASFEVDGVDPTHRSGWSVLLRGRLEAVDGDQDVSDQDDSEASRLARSIDPLPGGERPHVVRLHIDDISGRRIPPDAAWTTAHREHNTWTGRDGSDLLG